MLTWIRQWFKPPIFEHDDEKTHRAAILNATLVVAFWVTLIIGVGILGTLPSPWIALTTIGTLITIQIGMFVMLRRGQVHLTSILLVIVLGGYFLVTTIFFGGVLNVTFNSFVTVIIVAGLLLGSGAGLGVTAVGATAGLLILLAEVNGVLPTATIPISPIINWVGSVGIFLAASLLTNLAGEGISQALNRASSSERILAERNRDLQISQSTLEARTRELERRNMQLQTATEIGHVAAAYDTLNELLTQVTRLISQRFNAYHVGVFLVDDSGEYAVLQATNSLGGQKLLAQGHRQRVGQESIVGTAIANREVHMVQNIEQDILYENNPYLAETRSGVALPLIVGERLLGALDIQSTQESAFALEDINTLKLLADQVAVAISNVTLLNQVQASQEAERQAYGQMTRSGWQTLVKARDQIGYLCNAQGVVTPSTEPRPELMEAGRQGRLVQAAEDTVAVPIKVRDQSVAAIRFRKPAEAGQWTAEELRLLESLSDQLGLALESSRLYEDTQRRAARERLIGEITARVRESLDMETVLKTAIRELGDALNLEEVKVRLNSKQPSEPDTPRRHTGGLYG